MKQKLSDFQIETKFRRIAESTLQPMIQRLQTHIQQAIQQVSISQSLNQEMASLVNTSKTLESMIHQTNHSIKEYGETNIKLNSEISLLQSSHENERISFQLKIDDLNRQLQLKTRQLTQLHQKQEQITRKLEQFKQDSSKSTVTIHNKITQGLDSSFSQISRLKNQDGKNERKIKELEMVVGSWKQVSMDNSQYLKLYLAERDEAQAKILELESRVNDTVNVQELEEYKKHQNILLQATSERLIRMIDSVLPPEVVENLPSICDFSTKLDQIVAQQQQVQSNLSRNFQDLTNKILGQIEFQEHRITQSVQQQISELLNNKQQDIYRSVMSLIPEQEIQAYQNIKKQIPAIQKIKRELQAKSDQITLVADKIGETISNMSFKMTKVRTDFELRCGAIESDIKYLQKFREMSEEQFSVIGKLWGSHVEIANVMMAWILQTEATSCPTVPQDVFITLNDGIVCEVSSLPQNLITYRKKTVKKYDLLRHSMFSLNKLVDECFKHQFLKWKCHKPSQIFNAYTFEQHGIPHPVHNEHPIKKLLNRKVETPDPSSQFKQVSKSIKSSLKSSKDIRSNKGTDSANMSISLEPLDLLQSARNEKRPSGGRYEELASKTSRIRSRNLSRKPQS